MDRRRGFSPAHLRHHSEFSTATTRNGSFSTSRDFPSSKPNNAASLDRKKASYARLSRVMQPTTTFDDDDDDDHLAPPRLHSVRRPPSPATNAAALSQRPKRYPVVKSDQKAADSSLQVETSSPEPSPSLPVKTAPLESHSVEPSKLERPLQVETPAVIPDSEPPIVRSRDNGPSRASRLVGQKESPNNYEAYKLQDELDMLQYENESINEKLRLAEERCEAAEARTRQLEKQIASFGDGVSLDAKLSRKEAELREREEALKAAEESMDATDEEVIALRQEVKDANNEAEATIKQVCGAESEARTLNSIKKRMILTQEEVEEIVLKRCWLSRYWGLAVRFGVYLDIAPSKHEYWSSLAPLPYEVVIAVAQKAKEESSHQGEDGFERSKPIPDLSDIAAENTIESMLVVEKGLRELASLEVEDAVVLTMANCRRPNLVQESSSDLPSTEEPRFEVELSTEESDDVLFKQAWLAYYWGRAKNHRMEEDIAEERLQYWCRQRTSPLTIHDVVDAERGLSELRKLGIEEQLWEAYRRENDESLLLSNRRDSESYQGW